jgi:hypothetical protein
MPPTDPATWTDRLKAALQRYDPALVKQVAARLVRPRNEWPVDDLIERCAAAAGNTPLIDRRLRELDPAARRVLALIGHSRQPRWRLGSLLELLAALGHAEGPRPVFTLFEAGLLFPDLPENAPRLKNFEQWLGQASVTGFSVFAHPLVAARALGEDLGLPECPGAVRAAGAVHEADGLEWPLRLSVLWQQVAAGPLRRTQQGDFFKRDLDRLRGDPLLNAPAGDSLAELPDAGLLAITLAGVLGIVRDQDGELRAAALPAEWDEGLPAALLSLWAALPHLEAWDPLDGWRGGGASGSPFPSAYLLALLLLARLPDGAWARPGDVGDWVLAHHPYWTAESVRPSRLREWAGTFLLGLAHQFRWLQAARDEEGEWVVRLSPWGRWLLGLAEPPPAEPSYPQTLLVQPNLEVIAYRQGLTLPLIARLARFAAWKSLGAACTLQLEPETVYRALESGETFESILQALEQHGTRATPAPVVESLRTWANKRERLTVYPSAAILEFTTAEDLNEALARGLPGVRLSDRLAVVADEAAIDYRHFRLTGTRDYSLPPEKCVEVEWDGVTLTIDLSKSDLLLETELPRFAEPVPRASVNGRRQYRLTPASLSAAQEGGLSLPLLESWFSQRTGRPISPATRLLLTGGQAPAPELRRHLVLHVASEEIADGLMQWPATRELIQERLGPTALAVAEEDADKLREQLRRLGMAKAT